MARINKENAKRLAVAYSAYNERCANQDADGAKVWAGMLKKAQIATGIELISEEYLNMVLA